jgi:probable rRNA maturation factor
MSNHRANPADRFVDFEIALANEQSRHPVNHEQLCAGARAVLGDSEFESASLSIAVVDDASMHKLNRRYLEHDWPTDVLSFVLNRQDARLDGEIILSADTAATAAAEAGWPAAAEQLLYVIHGTLHLVGYRDKTSAESQAMRTAEAKYLRLFGFGPAKAAEDRAEPSVSAAIRRRKGTASR